ncbi:hypothetical protein L6164_026047 [Bauhinia variegata]|uniref:Uncharacterized protein n=1 Tax=Bauhinia variegata TaxID=167791 RepID=A0ACB9M2U8_BAUVA|nr:hypothetical protein L6164_026047 [Bauhinia variegata]
MNTAEDATVRLTKEVILGMIVTTVEVVEIDGALRMVIKNAEPNVRSDDDIMAKGTTHSLKGSMFELMMISRQKALHLALKCVHDEHVTHIDIDVVIVGASTTGLTFAYELKKNLFMKIAIIEQSISHGMARGFATCSSLPW